MRKYIIISTLYLLLSFFSLPAAGSEASAFSLSKSITDEEGVSKPIARKILIIGDSMTGWIADCINAYGKENGYDVAAVVWDGSTIKKWGTKTDRLKSFIAKEKPDAIFICLGLNELGERNPESQLGPALAKIKSAAGNIPILWIGPPSWPGKSFGAGVDQWLESQMGPGHYFSSLGLNLGRQSKTNPHPSKQGIATWVEALMEWMPANAAIALPGYIKPTGATMQRPKSFLYKRMKEQL